MYLVPRQSAHEVIQFNKHNVKEIRKFVQKRSSVSVVDVINGKLYVNSEGQQFDLEPGDYVLFDGIRIFALPRRKIAKYYNLEGVYR